MIYINFVNLCCSLSIDFELFNQIRIRINQISRDNTDSDNKFGSKMSIQSQFDHNIRKNLDLSQFNRQSLVWVGNPLNYRIWLNNKLSKSNCRIYSSSWKLSKVGLCKKCIFWNLFYYLLLCIILHILTNAVVLNHWSGTTDLVCTSAPWAVLKSSPK